jgi:sugar phosphate isomerase/epimerase
MAPARSKPRPSPYAINTYAYTLSHGAEACLGHLAGRGFARFELMMYPGHAWPAELDAAGRRRLVRLLEAEGLDLTTLNMPNVDMNVAGAAPEMLRYTLEVLRGIVALAGELGAPGVVLGPGKFNPLFPAPRERLEGWFFEALDVLVPQAERSGTAIWVENMPFAFLPDAEGLMAALERYGSDAVGVVYDVANGAFIGEAVAEGLARVLPRLKLVHVSDTGPAVYRHDPVGLGTIDFAAVARALAAVGYAGPPVLEIISREPDRDLPEIIARLAAQGWESLDCVRASGPPAGS